MEELNIVSAWENNKPKEESKSNVVDYLNNDEALDELILTPFIHITTIRGKQLRKDLLKFLEFWMPIPEDKSTLIEEIIYTVHNGSLLIDDIQDGSALRRGLPAAHNVFGTINVTIAADYLTSVTAEKCLNFRNQIVFEKYKEMLKNMGRGQGMEIYLRENGICPTEEEYLQMAYNKSALLFVTTALMVQEISPKKMDVKKLLSTAGILFQVIDDLNNLTSQLYHDSKGFCDDISEGKFSFPIIHAINNYPEKGEILRNILREKTKDIETKKYCLSLLEQCGSFHYTRSKINEMKSVVNKELARFPPNPLAERFINKIYFSCL